METKETYEIATARADPDWIAMTVGEIDTRTFGNSAVASSFISISALDAGVAGQ